MEDPTQIVDTIVIGGGPAGLSGALLLGRCRRSVLMFDEGRPRNERAKEVHAFLGHDGISPLELLERGRGQLLKYPNVSFYEEKVETARLEQGTFRILLKAGTEFRSRSLLVATGLVDHLPQLEGFDRYFGSTIHLCPFCDGWESADQLIGVLGSGDESARYALEMLLWSARVTLFVSSPAPSQPLMEKLRQRGVEIEMSAVIAVEGRAEKDGGILEYLVLEGGRRIPCERLFVVAPQSQHHRILHAFGCKVDEDGQAACTSQGETSVPGLYVAGNASKGVQLAMIAAAEGLKAAAAINDWLLDQDDRMLSER